MAKEADSLPGCIKKNSTSRSRLVILPVFSVLLRPHLERRAQLWAPKYMRGMDILGVVQQRARKMMKGLDHLF